MSNLYGNQFDILQTLRNDYRAISHEILTVTGATAQKLTVPDNANYALIEVESSVTSGVVIRYWLDGSNPTTTDGIGRSHLTAIDITENSNLKNFRVIATGAGTHKLMIQYFSK
jgi:hypothetical protein